MSFICLAWENYADEIEIIGSPGVLYSCRQQCWGFSRGYNGNKRAECYMLSEI